MENKQKQSLFLAIEDAAYLEQQLIEMDGELTPELEEFAKRVEIALPSAVDQEIEFLKKAEANIEYYRREADVYASIATRLSKYVKLRKDAIKNHLLQNNLESIQGEKLAFTLRNTKRAVKITDETALPKQYLKFEPNLSMLYDDLSTGLTIAGADLVENKALYKGPKKREAKP
jgi:hypothetical protein